MTQKADEGLSSFILLHVIFVLRLLCVRASEVMYVGVSLSFWNRARFFRLFSPFSPSSRSLQPCGLGRLRVCYLAATPLSNLQHRDARIQHTRLPCNRYALNSTRLENRPPAVNGMVSAFSRFRCSSPWTFRTGFKRGRTPPPETLTPAVVTVIIAAVANRSLVKPLGESLWHRDFITHCCRDCKN